MHAPHWDLGILGVLFVTVRSRDRKVIYMKYTIISRRKTPRIDLAKDQLQMSSLTSVVPKPPSKIVFLLTSVCF